jgi:predicted Zn-dependent protease
MRLIMGIVVAVIALVSYFGSSEYNPVTQKKMYLSLTPRQEIALGLQAAPRMMQQHGGLYPDQHHQERLDRVGIRLVRSSQTQNQQWNYKFHLLRDGQTINAFALPGGQVFITAALYRRLTTEGQLAGVLGHEIGHVVARHSAQRMAKANLTEGLMGAVYTASGDYRTTQMAQLIGSMINMKYDRGDELESDQLGIRFMVDAGYDPRAMIQVMQVLADSRGGTTPPEFFSTHPNPENRIQRIEQAIQALFPRGLPPGLIP